MYKSSADRVVAEAMLSSTFGVFSNLPPTKNSTFFFFARDAMCEPISLSEERLRSLLADMAIVCTSMVSTMFMISLGGTF